MEGRDGIRLGDSGELSAPLDIDEYWLSEPRVFASTPNVDVPLANVSPRNTSSS